jgi:hypothetical protein
MPEGWPSRRTRSPLPTPPNTRNPLVRLRFSLQPRTCSCSVVYIMPFGRKPFKTIGARHESRHHPRRRQGRARRRRGARTRGRTRTGQLTPTRSSAMTRIPPRSATTTATASSARTSPVGRVSMTGTGCVAQAMGRVFRLVVTTRVVCWSTGGR